MARGHADASRFLPLALALLTGLHLRGSDARVLVQRPVLQRSAAPPLIGTYTLSNPAGKLCIKATMGVQYIVIIEKRSWYLNLDPSRIWSSGGCTGEEAVLVLSLADGAAGLRLTFRKDNVSSYVSEVSARVSPLPVCKGCSNKTYSGLLRGGELFAAGLGQSYRCDSESVLAASPELRVKLVPLHLRAFNALVAREDQEVTCRADARRHVLVVVLGAMAVGLVLIALVVFLLCREDRTRRGYERL